MKIPLKRIKSTSKSDETQNPEKKRFRFRLKIIGIMGISIVAIYFLTGIYIVNPGEQAVVRRFGSISSQSVGEGLHYRFPWPIDEVQKVNVSEVRRADVGMSLPEHIHQPDEEPQAIQLLTGDENIITTVMQQNFFIM